MIEKLRKYPVTTVLIIAFYYGVGIFGLAYQATQSLFRELVPFTLICSLVLLILFNEDHSRKMYLAALVIFFLGFAIEVLGVNTGVIFGEYRYGGTLGIKLLDTPLMIGVNWLILIWSGWALTGVFFKNCLVRIIAGSGLMVCYDIALEPVAIKLDMWDWFGAPVPLQNYFAWFLASIILFFIVSLNGREVRNKIAPGLFIIQFVFFVVLNLIFSMT